MNKWIFIVSVLFLTGCKKDGKEFLESPSAADEVLIKGKKLFEGKGMCASCHLPDKKVIGPSITEIAATYKRLDADMVAFLQDKGEPIVDPSQYEVMRTNFAITKTMSQEELKAIEAYMYSFLKDEN